MSQAVIQPPPPGISAGDVSLTIHPGPADPTSLPAVAASDTPALRHVAERQAIDCAGLRNPSSVRLGKNVEQRPATGGAAASTIVATIDGNVRVVSGELSVVPLLRTDGAIAREIDFDGDLAADGALVADRDLHCTGDCFVAGDVQAADLNVGRSLIAHGKLNGRRVGRYHVGQHLICQEIAALELTARGAIRSGGDIAHSQITSGNRTDAVGRVYGGRIQANGGLICGWLGHEPHLPTLVEVGDAKVFATLTADLRRESERAQKQVAQAKARVAPFMGELKRLSPEQREKVTEFLVHVADVEKQLEADTSRLDDIRHALTANAVAEIRVRERAHSGVTIRLGGKFECTLDRSIAGPFRITLAAEGEKPGIVLIHDDPKLPIERLPSRAILA